MIRTRFSPLFLLLTCPELSGCQHGGQDARHDMSEDKNFRGSDASETSVPFLILWWWITERQRLLNCLIVISFSVVFGIFLTKTVSRRITIRRPKFARFLQTELLHIVFFWKWLSYTLQEHGGRSTSCVREGACARTCTSEVPTRSGNSG